MIKNFQTPHKQNFNQRKVVTNLVLPKILHNSAFVKQEEKTNKIIKTTNFYNLSSKSVKRLPTITIIPGKKQTHTEKDKSKGDQVNINISFQNINISNISLIR